MIHILVPTRGRPQNMLRLIKAFSETCADLDTRLTFIVDDDDPKAEDYANIAINPGNQGFSFGIAFTPRLRLGPTLNKYSQGLIRGMHEVEGVGFMGDDHLPLTFGWDIAYRDALREMKMGIVYGNDKIQGEMLPTQMCMSSNMIRALGYMVPPTMKHLYIDNFWLTIGRAIPNGIRYLPDIIIQHMHPVAKQAEWDDTYAEANANTQYDEDYAAWNAYQEIGFADDITKLLAVKVNL